jgi:N-acetylneuraminate synthase
MRDFVQVGSRRVGPGHPCFIIAEAGVNHNGKLPAALQLIDVAAEAGADAVKFQTFQSAKNISPLAPKAKYQAITTGAEESQLEMVKKLELSAADHRALADHCRWRGILFLSTPFDTVSADLLHALQMPVFKVPSGEITNYDLLRHVARKGKPVIMSTGMSKLDEVRRAVDLMRGEGVTEMVLLQCVSNYPADPADANLRAMLTMQREFEVPVGYSDHTLGIEVALAAVALGACVIEKHFTLDRNLPGPDHRASSDPDELAALVRGVRKVESAMGSGRKEPAASESDTAAVARRSLVAEIDIAPGTMLTPDMIGVKRPGTGLPPAMRDQLAGRTVRCAVPRGALFSLDMLT